MGKDNPLKNKDYVQNVFKVILKKTLKKSHIDKFTNKEQPMIEVKSLNSQTKLTYRTPNDQPFCKSHLPMISEIFFESLLEISW